MPVSRAWRLRASRPVHAASHSNSLQDPFMDTEQINLIGTTLCDLTERTQELRRYL